MHTARNVLKNTAVLGATQVIVTILGMVFIAFLARYIGAAGIGKLAFAMSLIAVFMAIPNFGFHTLMTRDVARDRNKSSTYIGGVIFIKLFLIVFVYFALFIVMKISAYPHDTIMLIYIVGISAALDSLTLAFVSIFRAFERMEYEAITQVFASILRFSLGLLAISLGYNLIKIVFVLVLAHLCQLLFSVFVSFRKKFIRFKLKTNLQLCKRIFMDSIPFGMLSLIGIIFVNTDKIMISILQGDEAIGWYAAANKLLMVILLVPSMYMYAIFPVFSRLHTSLNSSMKIAYNKSFVYLFLLGLPIAVGGFIVADKVILAIYGTGFENAIYAFKIMIWSIIFSFVGYANGAALNAIGKEKLFAAIMGVSAILNIPLNYVLIQKFGYIGACFATLIVTGLGFLLYSTICYHHLRISFPWSIMLKCVLSVSLMAGFLCYFMKIGINIIFLIVFVAPVIYFGILYILRTFCKEDIVIFKTIYLRGRS